MSWPRRLAAVLGLGLALVLVAHPLALGASDLWGNVAPVSGLGSGSLVGRYPLGNYALDQHFGVVSASLTGGVDASGVPPMIAYCLAQILWALTGFLANTVIALFGFAFSLDLLAGSPQTGGAGALEPVAKAIHSIYANVFGAPWLVLAVALVGVWAMWRALVQRRYSETAGALALSLIYVVAALFFVVQPAATIGTASAWANRMSEAFLSISVHGDPSGARQAKESGAGQLFELLVFKPWVVLNFGGIEHCVRAASGSGDSDPESVSVRPLSSDPARDAALSRRLEAGTEVSADGKVCVNNANKYASHFLRFGLGTEERDAEYDALDDGEASKLPDADPERSGYRLGAADRPATDAMEEGGQYQRLLLAIVVLIGELGAFVLLGALSVGVIFAQILLLLLLAFAPVALVAAAIPGRGHDFFRGWLEKLAGFLLRKVAYSLLLALLLAVNGALADATSQLGWLMSFGLQAIFFWAVLLQRKTLAAGLVGAASGPGAPGREGTQRMLSLYYGARIAAAPLGAAARVARSVPGRLGGRGRQRSAGPRSGGASAPSFGKTYRASVGAGTPRPDKAGSAKRARPNGDQQSEESGRVSPASAPASGGGEKRPHPAPAFDPDGGSPRPASPKPERGEERKAKPASPAAEPARPEDSGESSGALGDELHADRERLRKARAAERRPRPGGSGQGSTPAPRPPKGRAQ